MVRTRKGRALVKRNRSNTETLSSQKEVRLRVFVCEDSRILYLGGKLKVDEN